MPRFALSTPLSRVQLPRIAQFVLPVIAVALSTAVNAALQPLIDQRAPFLPYLVGVVVCALYVGQIGALTALGLSIPVIAYFWLSPDRQLAVAGLPDLIALAAYTTVSVLIIIVALQARAGRQRTERYATELAHGESRLTQAVTMADLAVHEWYPGTGELRWDARQKAMFGLPPDAIVGVHTHDDAIHPDDKALVAAARARCMDPAGDGVYECECRVVGYDGVTRWMAVRGHMFFESGKPARYLGVARETTAEHATAEALRQVAERARLLSAVSEAMRALDDPEAISAAAMRALCEHLRADRCVFVEFDAVTGQASFTGGWAGEGVQNLPGSAAQGLFAGGCTDALRAASSYVADDALLRLPLGEERAAHEQAGIRALIAVPLHRAGQLVAGTCVHGLQPRRWRADEVEAVQLVTERIWEALERARIARDLVASERRFRVAQDTSPIAFVLFKAVRDGEGQVVDLQWTYVNGAAGRIAQRAPAELIGRRLLQVFPGVREGTDVFSSFMRVVETGQSMSLEVPYRDAELDGTFLHAIASTEDGLAVWFMDITERRQAERALAQSARTLERERERLEIALRAGGMGVYEWRIGEPSVWWSPEIFSVYGVSPDRFEPTVDAFSGLVHPDDRALLWERTEASLANGGVFTHEYRVLLPTGELRWIANRSQVGRDAAGQPERITGVAVDITERKRAEHLLREADRRKDDFLATLAHELRNPLAPIRNAAALLEVDGPPAGPGRVARDVIKRQVAHMVRLVDDLLDVSRITRNRLMLQVEAIAVATVIEQAVEAVGPVIEAAQQEVAVEVPQRPLRVLADPVRLVQVLTNLLANASKYSPRGQRVTISARQIGRDVVLQVEDQGVGIAADELPRMFEMFSQASPALDRAQGGLGIGLWLSRQLVELQGGTISAASDGTGRGSRFTVHLPVAQAVSVVPMEAAPEQRLNGVQRVLVVDDNVDAATTLASLLGMLGCEVATAFDGPQALQQAETGLPDVVLLDIGLPHMNGYEVCRRLRARYGTALRIIAMTGWGQDEDRRRSREAGFDLHLVKPVDPAVLVDALNGKTAQDASGADTAPPLYRAAH